MHDMILQDNIPAMSVIAIDNVRQLETYTAKAPQTEIPTTHVFHAGVYARTIKIPAGVILTGALIKIATLLIADGDYIVYIGNDSIKRSGYHVFAASANRKQAFIAISDTYLTMIFATNTKSVQEAEEQFTDESDRLSSRHVDAVNHIIITGE